MVVVDLAILMSQSLSAWLSFLAMLSCTVVIFYSTVFCSCVQSGSYSVGRCRLCRVGNIYCSTTRHVALGLAETSGDARGRPRGPWWWLGKSMTNTSVSLSYTLTAIKTIWLQMTLFTTDYWIFYSTLNTNYGFFTVQKTSTSNIILQ